jgi:hypothetical protein
LFAWLYINVRENRPRMYWRKSVWVIVV